MKNKNYLLPIATMTIGMGLGAYMYSYTKKHPIKVAMAKNKLNDMMKDLK